MKKVLKKGKSGNRKYRLRAYEEMKSLNYSSLRIEFLKMLISLGSQAIEEELPSRNWSSLIVYSSLRKRSEYAIILGEIQLKITIKI